MCQEYIGQFLEQPLKEIIQRVRLKKNVKIKVENLK